MENFYILDPSHAERLELFSERRMTRVFPKFNPNHMESSDLIAHYGWKSGPTSDGRLGLTAVRSGSDYARVPSSSLEGFLRQLDAETTIS